MALRLAGFLFYTLSLLLSSFLFPAVTQLKCEKLTHTAEFHTAFLTSFKRIEVEISFLPHLNYRI